MCLRYPRTYLYTNTLITTTKPLTVQFLGFYFLNKTGERPRRLFPFGCSPSSCVKTRTPIWPNEPNSPAAIFYTGSCMLRFWRDPSGYRSRLRILRSPDFQYFISVKIFYSNGSQNFSNRASPKIKIINHASHKWNAILYYLNVNSFPNIIDKNNLTMY